MLSYFSSRICNESNSEWAKRRDSEIAKLRERYPDMQYADVGDGHMYYVERNGVRTDVGYFSVSGTRFEKKMPASKPPRAA